MGAWKQVLVAGERKAATSYRSRSEMTKAGCRASILLQPEGCRRGAKQMKSSYSDCQGSGRACRRWV